MFVKYLLNSSARLRGSDSILFSSLSEMFAEDFGGFVDTRSSIPFHKFLGFEIFNTSKNNRKYNLLLTRIRHRVRFRISL